MAYTTPSSALNNTQISELLPNRISTFTVDATTTLATAVRLMKEHHLTSLPVLDKAHGNAPLGWIDMRMVMFYLAWGKFKILPTDPNAVVFDEKINFGETPVADLLQLSPENQSKWEYDSRDPAQKLVDPFSKGVHRALIKQEGKADAPLQLITQSDFVRWIFHSHVAFAKVLEASVEALGLQLGHGVTSIKSTDTALDGFRRSSQKDLPAVAVVDATTGVLVGNLSASDLRGLDLADLRQVTQPVTAFLAKHSPRSLQPTTITAGATVRQAVQKMLQNKVHRVWVVDAAGKPTGVVSMTDVCYKVSLLQ